MLNLANTCTKSKKKDSIEFWEMQNAYNTPSAQMGRYAAAGLNPNMIYGKSGDNSASQIERTPMQMPNMVAPRNDFSAAQHLNNYFDNEIKSQTAENLATQNDVNKQELLLKAAQTDQVKANTDRTIFDYNIESGLKDTTTEFRKQELARVKQEIDLKQKSYDVQKMIADKTVEKMTSDILRNTELNKLTTKQVTGADLSNQIAEISKEMRTLDLAMYKVGLRPTDNVYGRLAFKLLELDKLEGMNIQQINDHLKAKSREAVKFILSQLNPFK